MSRGRSSTDSADIALHLRGERARGRPGQRTRPAGAVEGVGALRAALGAAKNGRLLMLVRARCPEILLRQLFDR